MNKNLPGSPRHVLLLVPGFPKDESDTTCIPALQSYVRALHRLHPECKLSIISFQYPFTQNCYTWNGIPVYPCRGENRGKIRRLWTWITALRYIRSIHCQMPVDVMHSFWLEETTLVGQWANRFLGVHHVASLMGQDASFDNSYLRRLKFDRLITTAGSANAVKTLGNNGRIDRTIPIGLDMQDFPQAKPDRSIDILGVGALTNLKNFSLFIDLIRELKEDHAGINCMIIGGGPDQQQLESAVAKHGLENNVRLTGQLDRPAVLQHMANSRILLHTSSYESQGYVFNEALYSGMSVVCFPVGNAASSKTHQCETRREMLQTLRKLLQSPPNTDPLMLQSIDETVAAFWDLYMLAESFHA